VTSAQVCVRVADAGDLPWLVEFDGHLDAPAIAAKVAAAEVVVAESAGEPVGLLRLDQLWSSLPFVALVRVAEPARRSGIGSALVTFVAERARAQGATMLLSSSAAGEIGPLRWHLAVGFEECGRLRGLNPGGADEVVYRVPLGSLPGDTAKRG
jgi:GNAT superfamily N-acetyltransferase